MREFFRLVGILIAWGFVAGSSFQAASIGPFQGLAFHRWGQEDGLPDDTVTALLQTRDGYLWIGTAKGLARFDGVEFDVIDLQDGTSNRAAAVTSLCEDESHRLWIGTRASGLFWLADGEAHRFAEGAGRRSAPITSLAADSNGLLWVGAADGLCEINLATLQRNPAPPGFTNDFISTVHAARSGTVWITTRHGMSQYKNGHLTAVDLQAENQGRNPEFIGLYEDRTGNLWAFGDTYLVNLSEGKRFNYFRTGDASSFRIWTLCEGSGGQLWIGTSGQGLFAFADGKFRPLALRENRLPSDVRAICEDRQGDLWLGTFGGGLIRLRVRREEVFDTSAGLPDETASCIAVSGAGRLRAGFQGGGVFAAAGRHFEQLGRERLISSIGVEPDGAVWAGTRGAGLLRFAGGEEIHFGTESGLASDGVGAVALEPGGAVWVGTSAGVAHRLKDGALENFGVKEGLSGAPISALLAGKTGDVWAGTADGEIFRKAAHGFERARVAALEGAEICALQEDAARRLWAGSAGRGLACLDKDQVTAWDTASGLPDNNIYGVLPDTNGVVWVATAKCVFRLESRTAGGALAAHLILESDANAGEMRGFPTAARSDDGRLWFAMPGEIVAIDPSKVEVSAAPPPVYIKSVWANNTPLNFSGRPPILGLPPGLTSLEIRFAALDLAEPEKMRFQHKLDGFDNGWGEASAERRVRYGRLPYGNYTFHVRARTADGVWSETQAQLAFVYPAPAWRSPGALALYILAAVAGLALAVWAMSHRRFRRKLDRLARQQAMEKERMRIAQDMHDEVGSKLTKIAYLSDIMALRVHGPEAESLQSIASTSRDLLQSLDEIVWAVNPRNDSLERLAAYLSQYATEYCQNTDIELELDLPKGLLDHPLSAETRHNLFLAFEEALANALKHSGATKVQVSMTRDGSRFCITVHDNGKGFEPGSVKGPIVEGNGLANMRQRLADVGGKCQIHSALGEGSTVSLTLDLSGRRAPTHEQADYHIHR